MKFINSRLHDLFKIRVVKNKSTKKYFVKGLDFWDEINFNNETIKQIIFHRHEEEREDYENNILLRKILNLNENDKIEFFI